MALRGRRGEGGEGGQPEALELLGRRLASGEIDVDEYERRRAALDSMPGGPRSEGAEAGADAAEPLR